MKIQTQEDVNKIISHARLRRLREKIAPKDAVTTSMLWTGAVTKDGYPKMFVSQEGQQTYVLADRFVFVFFYKKNIPEQMEIHHACDNRRCLNPRHLELATRARQTEETWKTADENGTLGRVSYVDWYVLNQQLDLATATDENRAQLTDELRKYGFVPVYVPVEA